MNRRRSLAFAVCISCGDRFLYIPARRPGKFCDHACHVLHYSVFHSELAANRRERRRKRHRSPAKTLAEDLAWLYEELEEGKSREYRGEGGAHTRAVNRRVHKVG